MDIMKQLHQIAVERDISLDELKEELEVALSVSYKKYKGIQGEVELRLDPSVKSGAVIYKEVVGEVLEPSMQVQLSTAQKKDPEAQIGDFVPYEVDPNLFGRIAAATFKQVLSQKLRDAELRHIHEQFNEKIGEVVSGIVTRRDQQDVLLQVNRHEITIPKREQVPTDDYRPQERMKVLILKIEEDRRGFQVVASRTHPNLVRRMLEYEVPELSEGIVEIKSIAREPGQRTKIAVTSQDERIDAVGSCVGQRGSRIQSLMDELRPEKIDVVPYSDDPKTFIINALSPAKVNLIKLNEEEQSALVIVPDTQLSLAIGRGGQNVRLAAKLTDWKIDIRSEQQAKEDGGAEGAEPVKQEAKPERREPRDKPMKTGLISFPDELKKTTAESEGAENNS